MDLFELLAAIPGAGWLIPYATLAIAVAAVIATALPPPAMPAQGWYPVLYHAINWLALNVGRARNRDAP